MKILILAISVIFLLTGLVYLGFSIRDLIREREEFDVTLVKDIHYDPNTRILTFVGGFSGVKRSYRGSCTVWHSMNGRRLDVFHEGWLYDIWSVWKYEQA